MQEYDIIVLGTGIKVRKFVCLYLSCIGEKSAINLQSLDVTTTFVVIAKLFFLSKYWIGAVQKYQRCIYCTYSIK